MECSKMCLSDLETVHVYALCHCNPLKSYLKHTRLPQHKKGKFGFEPPSAGL